MTHRERVLAAVHFEKPFPTPYDVSFTTPMRERMIEHTGNPAFEGDIQGSLAVVNLNQPEREVRPGFFEDEFGVVWNRSGADKDIGVVEQYLLDEPESLDAYVFPEVNEGYVRAAMESLMREKGDRFAVASLGFSLFERAWTLRGMESLLCDMLAEPDFVHALMERIKNRNLKILDIALSYDIDCFHFGDDWGQQNGLIMGPRCFDRFIKPYLSQMYSRVREAGKLVSQHSCGDLRPILADLHEMGLSIYQTFQPEIYGLDYARALHGKITVWGGISTQRELPVLSPDEMERVTRRLLRAFPDGGLIAAPTHAIPGDVPPENVLAMLRVLNHQETAQ